MTNEWIISKTTIGGYPALRNIHNMNKGFPGMRPEYETCLAGRLGEIWEQGDGTYKAFLINGKKYENIISFNSNDLGKWILKLKIPYHASQQLRWANNPNDRHKGGLRCLWNIR